MRITWIGLLVNVAMAGSKAVGGVVFHSQALFADAIHSLSDMVADFLTLATVNVALKKGTEKYPLGYGKLESVGTFMVSGVLLFAGITVGWSSLLQIFEYTLPTYLYDYVLVIQVHSHTHFESHVEAPEHLDHSHSHEAKTQIPNINAAWLALGSIVVKELLYRKTLKVAVETNSKVLVANAWHHRVDSLTAGVAFLTVTSGVLFGVAWLDAVGGVLVSILIINAGWGTFRESWFELVDRSNLPSTEHYATMKLIVETEVQNVEQALGAGFEVSDISVLSAGARTNLVVKLTTPTNVTLDIMNHLERDLVAGIRDKDRYVGKVFVEYELRK